MSEPDRYGIPDDEEGCDGDDPVNTDGDGTPDYQDDDSDGYGHRGGMSAGQDSRFLWVQSVGGVA